jgi:hypothetical protein
MLDWKKIAVGVAVGSVAFGICMTFLYALSRVIAVLPK